MAFSMSYYGILSDLLCQSVEQKENFTYKEYMAQVEQLESYIYSFKLFKSGTILCDFHIDFQNETYKILTLSNEEGETVKKILEFKLKLIDADYEVLSKIICQTVEQKKGVKCKCFMTQSQQVKKDYYSFKLYKNDTLLCEFYIDYKKEIYKLSTLKSYEREAVEEILFGEGLEKEAV